MTFKSTVTLTLFWLQVVRDAQVMLERMEHRGACGCDDTGDGAGLMSAIPHNFYKKVLA